MKRKNVIAFWPITGPLLYCIEYQHGGHKEPGEDQRGRETEECHCFLADYRASVILYKYQHGGHKEPGEDQRGHETEECHCFWADYRASVILYKYQHGGHKEPGEDQ